MKSFVFSIIIDVNHSLLSKTHVTRFKVEREMKYKNRRHELFQCFPSGEINAKFIPRQTNTIIQKKIINCHLTMELINKILI